MLARSLMHGSCETGIATATTPTASNHHALVWSGEIEYFLAGLFFVNNGSDRHLQNNVFPFPPTLVRAFAVTSALGLVFRIEAKVHQRVVALAGFHDDISALAAVAARRSAAGNIFFAAEGHAAIPAVARFHPNFCLVNEHGRY